MVNNNDDIPLSAIDGITPNGRNILDGVLIANEVVEGWKKTKKKGVLIKLDFEKAYDSINWGFLFDMFSKFGFGAKWINWMKECVTTARVSVLVNGSPTEEFVDDSLLFSEAEVEEVRKLKRVLRCFEIMSGLKINFHKSVICGVGVSTEVINEMATVLNCKVKSLPLTYLGLPQGANPRRKATWKPVVDKVRSKLAGWKRKMLSFAGRLILVKSVTSALPVFYLSLFRMPEGVAKELKKIQANFLWGGSELKRKIHMIKWEDMLKSMDEGGLGIRNLRVANKCLLIKWWWRFGSEKDTLWRKVICSRNRLELASWIPSLIPSNSYSPVWNGIISVAEQCNSLKEYYLHNFKLKVGDGKRIRFWSDVWCQSVCLKDEFLTFIGYLWEKKEPLRVLVDKRTSTGDWSFAFRRELYE
ncbi:uncharacterized protein LOC114316485 [Camellia sinensis]|uniref:uncharacterized protein LOC114316485 n=1 Tax=Camellia sinensis TaxID=4442 RepID=UPI0010369C4E|nr:uncharacterized protein LOC114316485 [Camellia sinensis]